MFTISDFFALLNSPGLLTGMIAIVCLAAIIWWLVQCSKYLGELCLACKEEIAYERDHPPIVVQATTGMSPEELATLIRDAEVLLEQERVA